MSGAWREPQSADVWSSLHDLSQPLTSLSAILALAENADGEERSRCIDLAQMECRRAIDGLRHLRSVLEGDTPLPQLRPGAMAGDRAGQQTRAGAA